MLDDKELEQHIHDLIIDICEVLYERGFDSVPIDAVMRLVGVSPKHAQKHHGEYFVLDKTFKKMLEDRKNTDLRQAPPGVTIH